MAPALEGILETALYAADLDAASALAIIESGVAIDLLFTDVLMPGPLRSTELARRAQARVPGLAVLFTSGYAENAIVHQGRLDEGINLIGKPYGRDDLARRVREVLADAKKRPAAGSRRRILLVEDEPEIRDLLRFALGRAGFQIWESASAEEALQRLDSGLPGVILYLPVWVLRARTVATTTAADGQRFP